MSIRSQPANKAYLNNWDQVFKKSDNPYSGPGQATVNQASVNQTEELQADSDSETAKTPTHKL